MYRRRVKIYLLTFSNGRQYAGQTVRPIRERLWRHRKEPCNHELKQLLDSEEPKIEILSAHIKQSVADAAEKLAIRKLASPINFIGVPGKKFTGGKPVLMEGRKSMFDGRPAYDRDRSERPAWCCGCQKQRSAKFFYADRSRSCGLSSRCKECQAKPKQRTTQPRVCSWCRQRKPADDYYSDKSRNSGLASICKSCHNLNLNARNAAIKKRKINE